MLHACYSAEYVASVIKVEVLVVNICILQNMKCIFFLWVVHGILFLFSFLIPILLKCDYFDVCWFLIFFFIYTCKSLECFGCVDCAIIFINLWHFSWVFEGAITYSYYQCHVRCPWFLCACVWESERHRSQK